MLYLGELAALITSAAYAVNSTLFTSAGKKVGALTVNRLRLVAACVFLALGQWAFLGDPWPLGAGWERWFWLGSSGIVGLVIGDVLLFQAFVWIGPRLAMLMMSLAPVIAAVTAWVFLGENLSLLQIAGIAITLVGIGWVVLERGGGEREGRGVYTRGILFGLGGAAGQGLGIVLAKPGLAGDFSALNGNFIRIFSALVVMGLFTLYQKQLNETIQLLKSHPSALWPILGGAFSGPFIGVSLSLYAIQNTSIGIASTLMALSPVFLLPVDHFLYQEKIGWGAVLGTVIALLGVALLFLF